MWALDLLGKFCDRKECQMNSIIKDVLDVVFSGIAALSTAAAVIVALYQANRGEQLNRKIVRMMIANDIKDDFQEQMTRAWQVRSDLNDLTNYSDQSGGEHELIEAQAKIDKQCSQIVAALKGVLGRFDKETSVDSFKVIEGVLYGVAYFSEVIVEAKTKPLSNWVFKGSDVDEARLDLVQSWFTHVIDIYSVYGGELGEELTDRILTRSAFPGKYGDDLISVNMTDAEIARVLRSAFGVDVDAYGAAVKRWLQLRVLWEYHALVLLSSSRFTNWSFDIKHASSLERSMLFNSLLGHLLSKTLEYSKEDFDVAFEKYGDN